MILITGATGFIGSYITKQLVEKGYAVKAIYRTNKLPFYIPAEISESIEWIKGDVLNIGSLRNAMADVDTIIHAAGVVSFSQKDRKEMYEVNVVGTRNIVNIAIEKNVQRFVHISSISAVGISSTGACLNEDSRWEDSKYNTHYALSKLRGEDEVWQGVSKGLNGIIVNPSTVLGYGDWNNTSCEIFKNVYKGFRWYTEGVNGFVDVEDVAAMVLLLMESKITNERFIINSENWSFKKLMDTIADGFGKKHPTRKATPSLLSIGWRLEKLRSLFSNDHPLLTQEIADVAHCATYFENNKVLTALPQFSFVPVVQTIENACQEYMANVRNGKL